MWTETLPAELPDSAYPPRKTQFSFGGLDVQQKQRVTPDFCCPPSIYPVGGIEVEQYQIVTPTSETPRLTTCVPFGDTSSVVIISLIRGAQMYISEDVDIEWKQNGKGNFVCLRNGSLEATVFANKHDHWQIAINDQPFARLVKNEWFDDPDQAMERAYEILQGAPCGTMVMKPQL